MMDTSLIALDVFTGSVIEQIHRLNSLKGLSGIEASSGDSGGRKQFVTE